MYLLIKPSSNSRFCMCLNTLAHPTTPVRRTLGFPSFRAALNTGPACSCSIDGKEQNVDIAKHFTIGFGSLQSCNIVLAARRAASGWREQILPHKEKCYVWTTEIIRNRVTNEIRRNSSILFILETITHIWIYLNSTSTDFLKLLQDITCYKIHLEMQNISEWKIITFLWTS